MATKDLIGEDLPEEQHMAKLAAVVETLDAVAEPARAFYTEQDGKFVLDVDVNAHPGVSALKAAHGRVKDEVKAATQAKAELEAKLKELEKVGESTPGTGKPGTEAPDLDKLRAKWEQDWTAKHLSPIQKQLESLATENRRLKLDDRVRVAATKGGVLADRLDDAVSGAMRFFDLNDKGHVVVLDADGDPSSVTLEKFFAEDYRGQKPWFYAPNGASGTGAEQGKAGPIGTTTIPMGDAKAFLANVDKVAKGEVRVAP